jgi:tetratricopeptide (TPR) repeat protein
MKKLVLILFFLANNIDQGQSPGYTQVDEDINNYIFSGEWLQAKSLIEQRIRENFYSLSVNYNIDDPTDLNIMGYYLMNSGRLDEALEIFMFNIELYPDVANCYDSLVECFMKRDENDEAIKYYIIAYEKLPADTAANDEFKEFLKINIEHRLEKLGTRNNS